MILPSEFGKEMPESVFPLSFFVKLTTLGTMRYLLRKSAQHAVLFFSSPDAEPSPEESQIFASTHKLLANRPKDSENSKLFCPRVFFMKQIARDKGKKKLLEFLIYSKFSILIG
jgi:hypothetical protein